MPLLRYRIGDVGTLRKRAAARAGARGRCFSRIDGRIEDYVVTPDGRRVGRIDHIFKDALAGEGGADPPVVARRDRGAHRAAPGYGADAQARIDREFRARLGREIAIRSSRSTRSRAKRTASSAR